MKPLVRGWRTIPMGVSIGWEPPFWGERKRGWWWSIRKRNSFHPTLVFPPSEFISVALRRGNPCSTNFNTATTVACDGGGGGGGSSTELPKFLSHHQARDLLDSVDAFLFDCDGVIWKGDKLINGVPETLDLLRTKGKKLVFVTNNSRKSRRQCSNKFQSLGVEVSEEEIFSSSFAAAMYLKVKNFPPDKKVYVIGEEGILDELESAGFIALGGPEDGKKTADLNPIDHDKSVGAVVVGVDRYINYYKLQYATVCIRGDPGCLFIATNRDPVGYVTDLQQRPGAGCMVSAVCGSTEKEPIVVGKPSTFMMDFLLEKYQIPTSRMCMVGDRLDTDILFGQNAGCRTLLVLSGVTTQTTLEDPSNHIQPEFYTNTVSDFLKLL